jgi:hypothetical protein
MHLKLVVCVQNVAGESISLLTSLVDFYDPAALATLLTHAPYSVSWI